MISLRFLPTNLLQKGSFVRTVGKNVKVFSTAAQPREESPDIKQECTESQKNGQEPNISYTNYRHIYPEFLPDPNPLYRNSLRERLERMDMLARRSVVSIPEFYVGSILAVTYSEPHATSKVNRFVGICILREGAGLRASFLLRNVINAEGIEVRYELYDPAIQKVECLRLERRLDNELLYLRDAPLEYSTFPFDMEPDLTTHESVPLNDIKVPLNPMPWLERWERKNLKGIKDLVVPEKRLRRAAAVAKPWEKYDLMKIYRETIPDEEQEEIFSDVYTELRRLDTQRTILKRRRILDRPKRNF